MTCLCVLQLRLLQSLLVADLLVRDGDMNGVLEGNKSVRERILELLSIALVCRLFFLLLRRG